MPIKTANCSHKNIVYSFNHFTNLLWYLCSLGGHRPPLLNTCTVRTLLKCFIDTFFSLYILNRDPNKWGGK